MSIALAGHRLKEILIGNEEAITVYATLAASRLTHSAQAQILGKQMLYQNGSGEAAEMAAPTTYMLVLERENGLEPSTLCLGSLCRVFRIYPRFQMPVFARLGPLPTKA